MFRKCAGMLSHSGRYADALKCHDFSVLYRGGGDKPVSFLNVLLKCGTSLKPDWKQTSDMLSMLFSKKVWRRDLSRLIQTKTNHLIIIGLKNRP